MRDANEPDIYPLDVSRLTKGQSITADECERISGMQTTHPRFPFALMELREWVMRESARIGAPLSVRIHGCSLVINTDAEASAYHARLAKEGERAIYRNLSHLVRTVDASLLTTAERDEHDRRLRIWGMKVARLKGAGDLPRLPMNNPPKSPEGADEGADD